MITPSVYQTSLKKAAFERRRFQRLKRSVQTELRAQGSETPVRTETVDISMGGCYIEMALTFEVGTLLKLVLWLGHKKLSVDAKVVTRHPQFGNGIEFGKMPEVSLNLLKTFLENAEVAPQDCDVSAIAQGLIV